MFYTGCDSSNGDSNKEMNLEKGFLVCILGISKCRNRYNEVVKGIVHYHNFILRKKLAVCKWPIIDENLQYKKQPKRLYKSIKGVDEIKRELVRPFRNLRLL